MAKQTILVIVSVLIIALSTVYGQQLQCYDCKSSDADKCLDPEVNVPKSTVCGKSTGGLKFTSKFKNTVNDIDKDVEARSKAEGLNTTTFSCYSIKLEQPKSQNASDAGIYRGCVELGDGIADGCNFIKEEVADLGIVTDCEICAFDRCNVKNVGGGSETLLVSIGLILANLALCVFVFNANKI